MLQSQIRIIPSLATSLNILFISKSGNLYCISLNMNIQFHLDATYFLCMNTFHTLTIQYSLFV